MSSKIIQTCYLPSFSFGVIIETKFNKSIIVPIKGFIMKYIITTLTSLFLLTACSTTHLPDSPNATLIMPSPPEYPIKSVREKIEGSVTMSFDVDTSGKPVNIKVIKAEPVKIFDKAAIRSLSKWRYAPKVVNAIAVVDKDLEMTIDFNLAK